MYLDITKIPFAGCAVDTIGMLATMSKSHKFTLTFICLLMSYLITVPLKTKKAEANYNGIPQGNTTKTSCSLFYIILYLFILYYIFYMMMEQN